MDQQAVQANMALVSAMTKLCSEKTIAHKHKSADLSSTESAEYKNCVLKFMETPQVVMTAFQGIQ